MSCVPQNNLNEHLARFAASKKNLAHAVTHTSTSRQFTFKKAPSLDKKNATTSEPLKYVENLILKPIKNVVSTSTCLPVENNTQFKKPSVPLQPKKQQTITSLFGKTSLQKSVSNCRSNNNTQSVKSLDEFDNYLLDEDDLSDFDLSSCKFGIESTPRKRSLKENDSFTEDSSSLLAEENRFPFSGSCKVEGNNSVFKTSTKPVTNIFKTPIKPISGPDIVKVDSLPDFIESTSILGGTPTKSKITEDDDDDYDDEIIHSTGKKRTQTLIISDDDDDDELEADKTKSDVAYSRSPSPETQVLDCFVEDDFSPADMLLRRNSLKNISISNQNQQVKDVTSVSGKIIAQQRTEKKQLPVQVPKSSEDLLDMSNYERSPLLQKDHFEGERIDMLQSILASLDEMNISVMKKICYTLSKDKAILEKNENLSSLMRIWNKISSQQQAAEKAVAMKKVSVSLNPNWSPECGLDDFKQQPLKKVQVAPLFPSSIHNISREKSPFSLSKGNNVRLSTPPVAKVEPIRNTTFNDSNSSSPKILDAVYSETSDILDETDLDFCDDALLAEELEEAKTSSKADVTISRDIYGKAPENTSRSSSSFHDKGVAGRFYGNYRDDGASSQFKGNGFAHSVEMFSVFRNVFGLQKFRHNQLEAINAALLGEDCFVLMPTGGGKSLCYQLPSLIGKGVTIVVSPLRSLIMDQVQKLWSLDVPANSLSGEMDASASNTVYKQLASRDPGVRILYVTPEKISASTKLISALENLYARKLLARFVIDEAHCVSEWGHDFRPDYKRLKVLREKFPGVPMIALTATATPRVRVDILQQLNMASPKWFLQSFNRPNLKYEVRPKRGKAVFQDIHELIMKKFRGMSGIVYCLSRNDCDKMASFLFDKGVKAVSYHAGLDNRNQVQEMWFNDKFKVVCATIAFGMGIDKPDVRFVIHHTIPKSIECYYQESGRAGRDGELSWCILYYSYQDMARIKRIIQKDEANKKTWATHFNNLCRIVHYCENKTDCRRVQMLEYFGEVFDKKLCTQYLRAECDNCFSKDVFENRDVTEDAKVVVQCISELVGQQGRKNYPLTYFIDIFRGSKTQKILAAGHDKLPLHGRGSKYHRSDAERLLRKLVLDQFLQENLVINQMDLLNSYVYPGRRANELLQSSVKVIFPMKKDAKQSTSHQVVPEVEDIEMKQLTERCYNELIEVSKALATERHMHYANIINVEALRQMSRELPMTEEAMLRIPHVTRAIYDKYGAKFLEVTERYGAERCVLEAERADKHMMSLFLDDNDDNWSNPPSPIPNKFSRRSTKRKKSTKGPPAKRRGKFAYAKNGGKKAKKGKFTKFSQKTNIKPASSITNQSTSRMPSSRVPGFLPIPKPQASVTGKKQFSRSFLPPPPIVQL